MTHESCVTKRELEEALRKQREDIDDDIMKKYQEAVEKVHKTAPDTIRELNDVKSWIKGHEVATVGINRSLENLTFAIFGDDRTREKGIKQQTQEMYEKIIQINGFKGFFQSFLLVGGVVAMLYALFRKF